MAKIQMETETAKIDADPVALGEMVDKLVSNKEFRASFERNPAEILKENGIAVSDEVSRSLSPEIIDKAIASMTEGGDFRQANVLVGVRVGTRPGTRPGVNVGVRVVTMSSTIAAARTEEDLRRTQLQELNLKDLE